MAKKPKILAADNTKVALRYMETVLCDDYEVALVQTGSDVLDYLESSTPDLVLMNASMSGMDGFEVLEKMKADDKKSEIPVVLMMSEKDTESELRGLKAGAMDFISLPFEPEILRARIDHIVELTMLRRQQDAQIVRQKNQIDRLFLQSMVTIAHAIDTKDRYAKQHSVHVALYSRGIARRMGYSEENIEKVYYIALLHDIGKIATPDSILNKAAELTSDEYECVKKHASIGAEIVRNTRFIPGVEEGVRYHHEWYDGSGYVGVKGDEIPEISRIIAVADAYEAMTSDRAYRRHLSQEDAINELVRGRGTQFDPHIVDVFLTLLEEGFTIDEDSVECGSNEEGELTEASALLRQVFAESAQETQSELASDSLTSFLNRRYFEEKINNYLLHPKSCGTFFMMDLDNFKQVNDTYGHKAGDELIQIFADVIRENVREKDFVCRIGGDEFAVFFPELDEERVICRRARNIIDLFAGRKKEAGYGICSVSIGIMTKYLGGEEMDCEQLYEKADRALYFVKNNGKDDYHLYASMPEELKNSRQNGTQMGLDQLMRQIAERKYRPGAYSVEYDRFSFIYQFIARNVERNRQHVQVILISMDLPEGGEQSLEKVEDSLVLLESAIVRSLRRGDVTSRFSSTQQIVLLMDSNQENGAMVAERILDKYHSLGSGCAIPAHFDIMEVPGFADIDNR